MKIQWYPGHMTKTKREMLESIKLVDIVAEIIDARIPISSRNPDVDEICNQKPRIVILNKADLANKDETQKWNNYFKQKGFKTLEVNSKTGDGCEKFSSAVREALSEKIASWEQKGQSGKSVKVMVVGVPNVGKSSFINRITKRKITKTEDRPGVTRSKQWVRLEKGLELLDTPGILWPKFDDERVGMCLAWTGAVKDDILDIETLSLKLVEFLIENSPSSLENRYNVTIQNKQPLEVYEEIAKKRGFIVAGGEADFERCAKILLDEFRAGKLGKITLEKVK